MTGSAAYFDTSVILKQYVDEVGAAVARALFRRHRIVSSAIAPVELISALSRRRTTGELATPLLGRILRDIQADRAYWDLVAVDEALLKRAEELLLITRLRAPDALHVASAQIIRQVSSIRLPFITADARQRDAAEQLGLGVIWVG